MNKMMYYLFTSLYPSLLGQYHYIINTILWLGGLYTRTPLTLWRMQSRASWLIVQIMLLNWKSLGGCFAFKHNYHQYPTQTFLQTLLNMLNTLENFKFPARNSFLSLNRVELMFFCLSRTLKLFKHEKISLNLKQQPM